MKLIPAGGSPRMQKAVSRSYVHDIVSVLLKENVLFRLIADFLKSYDSSSQIGLQEELLDIEIYAEGHYPEHAAKLMKALRFLYQQNDEDLKYQRGAILELLVYELVRPRYKAGECVHNHRVVDGKYVSDQIDVAVLSFNLRHIEGYECKLKAAGIESSDCTNLLCLAEIAQQQEYCVHVGIISLNETRYIQRHLQHLQLLSDSLNLYGLDDITLLQSSPL